MHYMSNTVKAIKVGLAAVLTVSAISLGVLAAPASASTANSTHRVSYPMTSHEVVSSTSNTAGGVLTLDSGQKLQLTASQFKAWKALPHPTHKDALVTPDGSGGRVGGDCGDSWITYNAIGSRDATIGTGFDVVAPAAIYAWYVDVLDNAGASQQSWYNDNYTGGISWAGYRTVINMAYGYSWAHVDTSSYTVLDDGGVCVSGGPQDETTIY